MYRYLNVSSFIQEYYYNVLYFKDKMKNVRKF